MNSRTNSNDQDNGIKALFLSIGTFAALLFIMLALATFLGFAGGGGMKGMMAMMGGYNYTNIALALASVNTILLLFLLYQYFEIYLTVKNEFTLYLILFAAMLLVYSITSNPLFYWNVFGFMMGGGPFVFIPLAFTTVATLILIYMSNK